MTVAAEEVELPEDISPERARLRLEEFYRKVNPRKLKEVENVLALRAEDLQNLFSELEVCMYVCH